MSSKSTVQKLQEEIDKYKLIIRDLEKEKSNAESKTFVKCLGSYHNEGCGISSRIDKLILVKELYYNNEPYSERWDISKIFFVCPKCGVVCDRGFSQNRLRQHCKNIFEVYVGDYYLTSTSIKKLQSAVKNEYGIDLVYSRSHWHTGF